MDSIENISFQQRAHVFEVANEIISNLPPKALQQLSEAYDNDIEKLLDEIFAQTVNVINFNKTIESQKIDYLEQVKSSMDNSLKKLSYNYFKTTMLTNFRQGWRNLEWGNMIQLFPNSVYLAARSHGKCLAPDTEVVMYSGEIRKVKDLKVGDLLMGVDSTPRKILELHTGTDEMFCVEQDGAENYVCNSEHILHYYSPYGALEETPVKEFINLYKKDWSCFGRKIGNIETKHPFKVSSIGVGEYIGFSVDKDHLFLLKDGTVLHNSFEFCYAFPLWRLYSYDRPNVMQPNTPDNQNRKETCIITNTITLGKEHIDKIVEEIEVNDLLAEKLNPNGKASLAATGIETELGAKIHLRGKDGFIRGLHVGAVVCDDLPDESSIYSLEQREKLHNLFKGAISPIVEPYGYFLVSGTPYQERDLYYELKQDKRFKVFEYPAIFPNGKLLAPDRFTFDKLMEEKASLGSLVFSREYLVVPISDDATIFPYEILMRSVIGMENISFSDNIEGFPIKLKKVVIGADFAISGNVSADYTVYTVWGMDEQGLYYLLHMYRVRGASHDEQINQLVSLDQRFKPNMIVVENNGFQTILGSMAKQRGLRNIEPFTTTSSNKKDLHSGLPSLAAMFERGEIRIPYKAGRTKELVDVLFGEFNSIAFRSDKGTLESVSGHEDTCMSSFFALTNLRENKAVKIKIDLV